MWTLKYTTWLSLLLVFCLALSNADQDIEIEIVEIFDGVEIVNLDDGNDDSTGDPFTTEFTTEDPEDLFTTETPDEPITYDPLLPWQPYHTRINVANITQDQFISENLVPFRESVARYTTLYCNATDVDCGLGTSASVFQITTDDTVLPEDVIMEKFEEVSSDLQVGYFVQLPNDTRLPRTILDDVMETYSEQIAEESGISFEIIPQEPITTTTDAPPAATEPPSGGLEPWEIALIVLGSVGGVCIIGGAVYALCFKKKDNGASFGELEYESTSRRIYDTERPEHTYESMAKNRQSVADDSNAGHSTTFSNSAYENNEYDNRR